MLDNIIAAASLVMTDEGEVALSRSEACTDEVLKLFIMKLAEELGNSPRNKEIERE